MGAISFALMRYFSSTILLTPSCFSLCSVAIKNSENAFLCSCCRPNWKMFAVCHYVISVSLKINRRLQSLLERLRNKYLLPQGRWERWITKQHLIAQWRWADVQRDFLFVCSFALVCYCFCLFVCYFFFFPHSTPLQTTLATWIIWKQRIPWSVFWTVPLGLL